MPRYDAVIVGAGHNGLVCAGYLARAGLRPLVLERRPVVGGIAVTEELCPGFRCPTLEHVVGPLAEGVATTLGLARHGLRWLGRPRALVALAPDGGALVLDRDPRTSAESIGAFSRRDAQRYVAWHGEVSATHTVVRRLAASPPPDIDAIGIRDLRSLLIAGGAFYRLSRTTRRSLLRWLTLPVADLVAERFESDLLQSALAARALDGVAVGPRAGGTGLNFLLQTAANGDAATSQPAVAGGPGALTQALAAAATAAGAEIRTDTVVERIAVEHGAARAVVLSRGDQIDAPIIVSNADPRSTLLRLVNPDTLDPRVRRDLESYRSVGTVAKVNLALDTLPSFAALRSMDERSRAHALAGRIHLGPTIDYLERAADAAKYGQYSDAPILDITLPSVSDPTMAPAGRHVMSIRAQFAPYALSGRRWKDARDELTAAILRVLSEYAPDVAATIVHQQVLTPADIEATYGLSGGHLRQGELALDQLFAMRPLPGWARYRTPIRGLYLCGSGTHPGVGVTGASGKHASRAVLEDPFGQL